MASKKKAAKRTSKKKAPTAKKKVAKKKVAKKKVAKKGRLALSIGKVPGGRDARRVLSHRSDPKGQGNSTNHIVHTTRTC